MDDLGKRKLRDITDFEWKRNMRFYGNICEEGSKLLLLLLATSAGKCQQQDILTKYFRRKLFHILQRTFVI